MRRSAKVRLVPRSAIVTMVIAILSANTVAIGQPKPEPAPIAGSSCTASQVDKSRLDAISAKYKDAFDQLRQHAEAKSKSIQDEGPPPDNTGAAQSLKVWGHIEQRHVAFKMDVPEVTMKTQEMSINLPQITMKRQTWSYNTITLVSGQECHAGPDIIQIVAKTCHNDFPPINYPCPETRTVRGPDICLPTVTAKPVKQEISLDVPETKVGKTTWKMDVPEFTMKTQELSFDYPVFIVDNVEAEASKQQKDSEDLSNDTSASAAGLTAALKQEYSAASLNAVNDAFACQEREAKSNIRDAYNQIQAVYVTTKAGFDKAQELKSGEMIASYQTALASLANSKAQMITNYIAMRRQLNADKLKAFSAIHSAQ